MRQLHKFGDCHRSQERGFFTETQFAKFANRRDPESHKPNLPQAKLFDEYHHDRSSHNYRTDPTGVRLGKKSLIVKCRRVEPTRSGLFVAASEVLSKDRAAIIFH